MEYLDCTLLECRRTIRVTADTDKQLNLFKRIEEGKIYETIFVIHFYGFNYDFI